MQLLWAAYDGELRVSKGICVHAAAPGFFFSIGRRNRSSAVRACCLLHMLIRFVPPAGPVLYVVA
jgi:hypothetical protein